MFFSADIDYPKRLETAGLAEPNTLYPYATGKIVVWVPNQSKLDLGRGLRVLLDPGIQKIAIANPAHAPYGRAAVAALRHEGLYDQVSPKFVLGENISQTATFVVSGSADVGILALSLALAPSMKDKGRYAEIPAEDYPAIEQGAVILKSSPHKDIARQFVEFVKTPPIQDLLRSYGFAVPAAPGLSGKAQEKNSTKGRNNETVLVVQHIHSVDQRGRGTDQRSSKAAPRKPISKKPSASARVTSQEVQELRDALAAQQKQSEEQRQQLEQLKSQLQQLLDATQQASATAQKVQGSAEQAQATAAQAQQSAAEAQHQADQVSSSVTETKTALALVDKQSKDENKKLSALQEALGRFRFIGDIRVRGEDFFQDCSSCVDPQSRPYSAALRRRRQAERGLYRWLPAYFRLPGRFQQHQRNPDQFLYPQDHRHRPCLRDLSSRRPRLDQPHRWQIWLYLATHPDDFRLGLES